MTTVDLLVDAWVWFAHDPEASMRERMDEIIEVLEFCMEAWFGLLLVGVVAFHTEEDVRLEAALVTLLGAIGLLLWTIPAVGFVLVAEVIGLV